MTNSLSAIAWGLFCACSWTWCIGMYLPALMVERYGPMGFVVFAVPNVLGCSLMGYVIRSTASSRELVARHGTAMAIFSLVTIAFHMFFLAWAFEALVPIAGVPSVIVSVAVLGVAFAAARLDDIAWIGGAAIVYVVSLAAFWSVLTGDTVALRVPDPTRDTTDVLWLAPVITAGFLCSPYLDATFHRARQCATTPHAFMVFGLTFGAMIVLTLFVWLRGVPLSNILITHLLAQSVFTVGAHARELRGLPFTRCRMRRHAWLAVALAAALLHPLASLWSDDVELGRNLYLRFLVAYGLLAPAYVLLFVGPRRTLALKRTTIAAWAIVVAISLPLYELAFVGSHAWAVAIPAVAAVAWLARRPRPAS